MRKRGFAGSIVNWILWIIFFVILGFVVGFLIKELIG